MSLLISAHSCLQHILCQCQSFRTFDGIMSTSRRTAKELPSLEKEESTDLLTCFTEHLDHLVNHLDLQALPVLLMIEALRSATITFLNAELRQYE